MTKSVLVLQLQSSLQSLHEKHKWGLISPVDVIPSRLNEQPNKQTLG